jgi:hypothetical protein
MCRKFVTEYKLITHASNKLYYINCFIIPHFFCVLKLYITVGAYQCFGGTFYFHHQAKNTLSMLLRKFNIHLPDYPVFEQTNTARKYIAF